MAEPMYTGEKLVVAETTDQSKVPFSKGQLVIEDGGSIYYDNTQGESQEDRIEISGGVGKKSIGENAEIFNDYTNNIAYGNNSHVEGSNTITHGDSSHAEGYACVAGTKAFSFDLEHEYVSDDYNTTTNIGKYYLLSTAGITEGLEYSLFLTDNFDLNGKVISVGENYIEVNNYIVPNLNAGSTIYQYSCVFFPGNPDIGNIFIGTGAHAEGRYTKAMVTGSHAEGSGNMSAGKYSHTEGLNNKAVYAAHAEGQYTSALAHSSHSEGRGTTVTGYSAHAEGVGTTASGRYSHAEGENGIASGQSTHVEGIKTEASGYSAHAEGMYSTSSGYTSHAEGYQSTASGSASHSEGKLTQSTGNYSHAEGNNTIAEGESQHVQGKFNIPLGNEYADIVGNGESDKKRSNAYTLDWEGNGWFAGDVYAGSAYDKLATENWCNALSLEVSKELQKAIQEIPVTTTINKGIILDKSQNNVAAGYGSVAMGIENVAGMLGYYFTDIDFEHNRIVLSKEQGVSPTESFDIKYKVNDVISINYDSKYLNCSTIIGIDRNVITVDSLPFPPYAYAEINNCALYDVNNPLAGEVPVTESSFAGGKECKALGALSIAIGNENIATGYNAIALGSNTKALDSQAYAEGLSTTASGGASHAEGCETIASGTFSHAEGYITKAESASSHAEGYYTKALGGHSHAEGLSTTASGDNSHAEGLSTTASGDNSHAEGYYTKASGEYSHAEGKGTIARGEASHAQGKYNIEDIVAKYAHIVGNGKSDAERSNAHTLDWEGNAWFAGQVEATSLILKSSTPGSTKKFRLTIDDDGVITTTELS